MEKTITSKELSRDEHKISRNEKNWAKNKNNEKLWSSYYFLNSFLNSLVYFYNCTYG